MKKLRTFRNPLSLKKKIIFVLCLAIGIGLFFFLRFPMGGHFLEGTEKMGQYFASKTNLSLKKASIAGHYYTHKEDVIEAIHLEQNSPIFQLDLDTAIEEIKKLPWVKEVSIQRVLPDSIHIQLVEKIPLVSWQNNYKYLPIDTEGKPIADEKTILSHLILVVGTDAPQHSPDLIKNLSSFPKIMQRVKSAVRVGGRRWNLILDDIKTGTQIYLPDTNIYLALQRLNRLQEESRLLDKDLEKIDVRIPDRLIVKEKSTSTKGKK